MNARRAATWLRYHWHHSLLHMLLLGLGLLNLYPFFWMLGTSLKSEAEASNERLSPFPVAKYKLASDFQLERVLPSALEPALAGTTGAVRRAAILGRLRSKVDLVSRMQRGDEAYARTTARDYARLGKCGLDEARAALESMAAAGLLRRQAGADTDDGPVFTLAAAASGPIGPGGLLPRQVLTLWSMRDENIRRAESRQTFAEDRWSARDYASAHGLADARRAEAELAALRDAGLLADATLQARNYWVVLKGENFLLHFLTSLLVTGVVVFGTVLLSSMPGYALARMPFPGKFLVLGVMIAASVLPSEARIIPIFKMLNALGAMSSLWGMTLWLTSFGVGNALLMAGFFLGLPKEVDEAAQVDGAGVFRTFFDVALPMARPIVTTVALFAFLMAWNDFLIPLLCTISRPGMQPLAVAVYNFQQGHPGKWQEINAAAAVMVVPVILLFLLVQKHVVKSVAAGAVKG